MTLDDYDLAILRSLQESTRLTSEEIGARVNLSASACQRRIRRLREEGFIEREVAVLARKATGARTTVIVEIVLERGGADMVDAFRREIAQVPEVQQVYYVTGACDFVLIVTAESVAHYEQLTRRLFFDNPRVHRFNSIVVMDTVKAGLEVPI